MKNFNLKAISTGVILLISSGVLCFLIVLLINTSVAFNLYRGFWGHNFQFVIDKNDQKFLLKNSYDDKKVEVYDLEKKLLKTEVSSNDKEPNKYLAWETCRYNPSKYKTRELSGYIRFSEIINKEGNERWYFLSKEKYLIGYDTATAKVLGYIGANGFSVDLKNIHPFDEFKTIDDARDGVLIVVTGQKGYCIQVLERKMITFENESDEKIDYIYPKFDLTSGNYRDAVLKGFVLKSDKRIKSYLPDGTLELSLVFPEQILEKPFFSYLYNGKLYVKLFEGDYKTGYFYVIKEISPKGEVVWEYAMDKTGVMYATTPIDYNLFAVPFMGRMTMNILNRFNEANPFEPGYNISKIPEFRVIGNIDLSFWLTFVLAIICMIYVYSHLNKRTDSKFIIYSWLLVIFVFSLPGVMAYLLYNRNSKLIPCVHCGNQFLPIKNTCLICSHEIPLAKTDGREIFTVI